MEEYGHHCANVSCRPNKPVLHGDRIAGAGEILVFNHLKKVVKFTFGKPGDLKAQAQTTVLYCKEEREGGCYKAAGVKLAGLNAD